MGTRLCNNMSRTMALTCALTVALIAQSVYGLPMEVPNQGTLDCGTDGAHFLSINVTNPTVIKVKVKTCDAEMCQGNPAKPNAYTPCGGPNDRVMGKTSKTITFNENTTYF